MSWFKVDDQFPHHPKVLRAGADAAWLFICGGCYCAKYLTDGLIPKEAIPTVSSLLDSSRLAARLVEVGLWHDRNLNYEVHDYLDYNPSRAQVLEERERARERRKTGGRRSAERRANVGRTSSGPTPTPDKSSSNSKHQEIFGALIQSFGAADTTTSRQFYGKIARELVEVGATPEEVCKRAQVMFERDWKNPSPAALSKHWASLVASNGQPGWDPTRASHARSSL